MADMSKCSNPVEVTLKGDVKMKFCEIPAAKGVLIGSENGQSHEKPVKARDFESFQIGQFEVTQLQYKTLMENEPWKKNDGSLKIYVQAGDDNPAVYVSHHNARLFARMMSLMDEGAEYRLPTEAEWEYASRGGTDTAYYWGDDFNDVFAYSWSNSEHVAEYGRGVKTCPNFALNNRQPGYCANDFGLMHMLGNVWEWVSDVYVDSYENAPRNGNEAVSGSSPTRTLRGGGWANDSQYLRSAYRNYWVPDERDGAIGFRLVRIPTE